MIFVVSLHEIPQALRWIMPLNISWACGNWQHTANAAILGHNNGHLDDVTIEQCKDSCCANPQCKSFDYYKQSSECDVSYSSAFDVGGLKTDYAGNPYDHYALDRGNYQSLFRVNIWKQSIPHTLGCVIAPSPQILCKKSEKKTNFFIWTWICFDWCIVCSYFLY